MNKIEIEVPEGKELDHIVWKDKSYYDYTPKKGQTYYLIDNESDCYDDVWNGCDIDLDRLNFHVVYPNKNLAKKAVELTRRSNAIIRACLLVDPDFEPDWNNPDQEKWFIFYCCNLGSYDDSVTHSEIAAPSYVSSSAKAREAIKLIDKWKNEKNNNLFIKKNLNQ